MKLKPTLTPMIEQYQRIKGELPKDSILLFRLGDFYEMFFEDAEVGSALLRLPLTRRGTVPMCGIPWHALDAYVDRLLKAGKKVAMADTEVTEPRPGQVVKREVKRLITPTQSIAVAP